MNKGDLASVSTTITVHPVKSEGQLYPCRPAASAAGLFVVPFRHDGVKFSIKIYGNVPHRGKFPGFM